MMWVYVWIATQIITESLPVSSSSHMRLLSSYIQRAGGSSFLNALPRYFDDFLHLPTLLMLIVFFWYRWAPVVGQLDQTFLPFILRVLLASGITVLFYGLFSYTGWREAFPLVAGLLVTSLLLFSLYLLPKGAPEAPLSWGSAAIVGVVQGISLLPGISRLGATFVVSRWLGISSPHALEFSCAIQVPLIIAAVIRSVGHLLTSPLCAQLLNPATCLVMLFSGIVSYYGFWVTWTWALTDRFWWFGFYVAGLIAAIVVGGI